MECICYIDAGGKCRNHNLGTNKEKRSDTISKTEVTMTRLLRAQCEDPRQSGFDDYSKGNITEFQAPFWAGAAIQRKHKRGDREGE